MCVCCSILPEKKMPATHQPRRIATSIFWSVLLSSDIKQIMPSPMQFARALVRTHSILFSKGVLSLTTTTTYVHLCTMLHYNSWGSPHTSQISHLLLYPSLWLLVPRLSSQLCHCFLIQLAFEWSAISLRNGFKI